jgi:1,4-dihydroxy-2-naphthoyl-CoA hydrolase
MTRLDPAMDNWPYAGDTINERLGIEITEASPQRVSGTMPVDGNRQPFGLLHGASLYASPDRVAVGVDINATHHRAVAAGTVTGVATPLHLGRSVACYEIVISDDRGRRVCTARITCNLVAKRTGEGSDRSATTP